MKNFEIKNNSSNMQNTSQIGYKTFASQFIEHGAESPFQQITAIVKKNKAELLHYVSNNGDKKKLGQKSQKDLSLLHFAAYFNSAICALYLLYKNASLNSLDKQGKSVFHICAYTGHLQTLVYIHQFWKIVRISHLNQNFLKILIKIGFKRTDAKNGCLKSQVSRQRQNKFSKGQQQILRLYKQYRKQYIEFILKSYQLQDTAFNRNCFHYVALNKYHKCLTTMQYMMKSLQNYDLCLSSDLLMSLYEISTFIDKFQDPRQLQDCLINIRNFLQPQTMKNIQKQQTDKIKWYLSGILQSKDNLGHTPIYLASKTGSASLVSLLKKVQQKSSLTKIEQNKTFVNDDVIRIALNNSSRNKIIDLCEASKNSDVATINFLISCGQQVNKKKTIFGTFALLQAVKSFQKDKNIEPIKILLKSGADVNQQDSNGWTIFHHMAEKGLVLILREVCKQRDQKRIAKLNINKVTNKGYHPLHIAALNNQVLIIKQMMNPQIAKKYDINVNPLDQQKSTILHFAAKKGCMDVLGQILRLKQQQLHEKLIDQQIKYRKQFIGAKDVNDNTCLHIASVNNHTECVKLIIKFDSDEDHLIKLKNKKGKLAKQLTLKNKCFDSIFAAARQGDVNMIRNLTNQHPDLKDQQTPIMNRTPLILSVLSLQLVNVKFLVDIKADQQHTDKLGKCASTYAKQMQGQFQFKDRTKLQLIRKIRALLK